MAVTLKRARRRHARGCVVYPGCQWGFVSMVRYADPRNDAFVSLLDHAVNGARTDGTGPGLPPGSASESIAVFERAPELLRELPPQVAAELARLRVPVLYVEPGPWRAPGPGGSCHFGFLVLEGVLLRRVSFEGRTGAELLGSGDLLRPWIRQPPVDTATAEARWRVLERAELAVLGSGFARRVARWPQVAAALLECATERARMLAFQQVATHIPGLEGRLLAMLWALADRWGRVTPDGVAIPMQLTHATLAELVGASRPSVSSTLKVLERQGSLERNQSGWLLRGPPLQSAAPAGDQPLPLVARSTAS